MLPNRVFILPLISSGPQSHDRGTYFYDKQRIHSSYNTPSTESVLRGEDLISKVSIVARLFFYAK
jgi:hypothetical protein